MKWLALIIAAVATTATRADYALDIEIAIAKAKAKANKMTATPKAIQWKKPDPKKGLSEYEGTAVRQFRPIWIHCTNNSCTACERQKKEVFTLPEIIEASDKLICVELNINQRPDIAEKWNIPQNNRMPLEILFRPWLQAAGRVQYTYSGSDPETLARFLKENDNAGED